jgi:serine/threonine protein kinase
MIKCFFCGAENSPDSKFCHNCGNSLQGVVSGNKPDADVELLSKHLSPKFSIEKKIGKGGMATVYLGEQTALQRKIVVKILNKDISDDEEIRERFLLEARTPAKLRHPNIVEIIDVGIVENRPYYIMEYASGGSVAERIKKYKDQGVQFPVREAISLITKVLDALHYCHLNNLQSHRDIKPANIMYRSSGEPIIVDFGIAKVTESSITRTKMTMGTANYMSPEQCQGRKDIDGRSDVYSVGIMLFEIVTGELPFKGDSGLSIMIKQVKEKIPSLGQKVKSRAERPDPDFSILGGEMENIIERACAKNKSKRYQTAKEFAEALSKVSGDDLPLTLNQNPIGKKFNLTLVLSILVLGLSIGSLIVYKLFNEKQIIEKSIKNNLRIESTPLGAKLIDKVSNQIVGKTPFETMKTESGIYKFKAELDGYQEVEIETEVKDVNQMNAYSFKLELIPETPSKDSKTAIDRLPDNGLINYSGLVWQTNDIKTLSWYQAVAHCKSLGMRLPTRNEFRIAYNSGIRKLTSPCCEYWTATSHEDDPDSAYNISMRGYENFYSPKANRFLIRCVAKQ